MEIHRRNRRARPQPRLVAVRNRSFVLAALLILMCVFPAAAQPKKLSVTLDLQNNPVGVRDRIYLTVYVRHPDAKVVKIENPILPDDVEILTGPYIQPYADETDKDMPIITRITYILRANEMGRFIIGPFLITAADMKAATDPFVLSVGYYQNRRLTVPLFASWDVPERQIVVGEAVPVFLMLDDLTEIPLVDSFEAPQPTGALFEAAPGLGEISSRRVETAVLYRLPVTSFVFTPSVSGRVFIPSAVVRASGTAAETGTVRVDVEPLPAGASTTGAIGDFSFISSVDVSRLVENEEAVLTMRVEGSGNLNYLQLPVPDFSEFVVVDRTETGDFYPSDRGYTGNREARYRFVAEEVGRKTVTVPAFVWLDAETRRVRQIRARSFVIDAVAQSEPAAEETEFPFVPATPEEILSEDTYRAYSDPLNYLWLIPGAVLFGILLTLKRTKVILAGIVWLVLGSCVDEVVDTPDIDAGLAAYRDGNYSGAAELFRQAAERYPRRGGLMYNLALASYRRGDLDAALHFARTGARYSPMDRRIRELIRWINEREGLEFHIAPAVPIDPDILFYVMLVTASLGFAVISVQLARPRGGFIIAFVLCMFVAAGSVAALGVVTHRNSRPAGVVRAGGAVVRRIPGMGASPWLEFDEGTCLLVLNRTGDFYLIETGYGLKGWVEVSALFLDGSNTGTE